MPSALRTAAGAARAAFKEEYDEEAFRQWVVYHVARGELEEARKLGWDGRDPPPPTAKRI